MPVNKAFGEPDGDLLSLVRGALLFADVLAMQHVLGDRELISRDVEITISHWIDDNYDVLSHAGRALRCSDGDECAETVEYLLKDLARRLPVRSDASAN